MGGEPVVGPDPLDIEEEPIAPTRHWFDIFTCEMEHIRGEGTPRWYIWENVDGKGGQRKEHVILDANLGGHEAIVGDVTGNGRPDIIGKPWYPHPDNAVGGKAFVVFLENTS